MRSPEPNDRLLRAQVLEALGALQMLAECWEPCGALVEEARMALAGEGGLSASEVHRLRTWAARWQLVDPRLRQLYVMHYQRGAVQAALWAVLAATTPCAPSGAVYGSLRALWVELYHYEPAIELVPYYSIRKAAP